MRTDEEFYLRFPALFRRKIQIAVGNGWRDLVWNLCERIDDLMRSNGIDNTSPRYPEAVQIKQKLGSLRFYFGGHAGMDDKTKKGIVDLIAEAEDESVTICEICGAPGKLGSLSGYRATLCPACAEAQVKERTERGMKVEWKTHDED